MRQLAARFGITGALARWLSVAGLAAASMLLTGCASHSYMGICSSQKGASPELRELAARAQSGDKEALLELGDRFQNGQGVVMDLAKARRLYTAAAADSGGMQMLNVPTFGRSHTSSVPINLGATRTGLLEAKTRLAALDARIGPSPEEKYRSSYGEIVYVVPSQICDLDREAVQRSASLAVGECRATSYRLTESNGRLIELVDLVLTTRDTDAATDMHIPFALIDTAESELFSADGKPVRGTVTYSVINGTRSKINVIRSFVKEL